MFQDAAVFHPCLPQLILDLSKVSAIKRVWLFGSRARGDQEERSDIDLAIEAPDISPEAWSRIGELVDHAQTLLKIDWVNLERAPSVEMAMIN
jgi:predicted nucleotidyltransferase